MRENAIRDTEGSMRMSIAPNVDVNLKATLLFHCTCPSGGCGLHIALRNFGEGIQLLHQSQSLFLGKSPHFRSTAKAGLTDSLIKQILSFTYSTADISCGVH